MIYGVDNDGNECEVFYSIYINGLLEFLLLVYSNVFRCFGEFNYDGMWFIYVLIECNGCDFDIYEYNMIIGKFRMIY